MLRVRDGTFSLVLCALTLTEAASKPIEDEPATWAGFFSGLWTFMYGLVQDALYSMQKDAVRALIVAAALLLVRAARSSQAYAKAIEATDRRFQRISSTAHRPLLALGGALALLLLAVLISLPMAPRPPPMLPPPPPPVVAVTNQVKESTGRVVKFVKEHPFQVAAGVSVLLLTDYLNLLVVLDAADPFLLVWRPFATAARYIWRLLVKPLRSNVAKAAVTQRWKSKAMAAAAKAVVSRGS